jgi:hypothetical protein
MLQKSRQFISSFLIVVLITVSLLISSPANASANIIPFDLNTATDTAKNLLSNGDSIKNLLASKQAIVDTTKKLLANKQLVQDARNFLNESPEQICSAYVDLKNGNNTSQWDAIIEAGTAALKIGQAVNSASIAGAGSLTGYAGMASAVSQLGLGGLTQAAAGVLGSNAVGAAATSVVTSAVGGPIVMAALVAVGIGVTTLGTGEITMFVADKLGDWAENSCNKSF